MTDGEKAFETKSLGTLILEKVTVDIQFEGTKGCLVEGLDLVLFSWRVLCRPVCGGSWEDSFSLVRG